MVKYEDHNMEYYSDSDLTKRVLTHPATGDISERMVTAHKGWKNPFREAYIWFKGELLDIKGMNDAVLGRENVIKQMSNVES